MGSKTVGKMGVQLGADTKGFKRGMADASKTMKGFAGDFNRLKNHSEIKNQI